MELSVTDWLKENDQKLKSIKDADYKYEHFDRVRQSAKRRGIKFDITPDDLVYPEVCPVLGIELSRNLTRDHLPSVDRLDSTQGYIKGNVCIMSHKANNLKGSNTLETLEKLIQFMKDKAEC